MLDLLNDVLFISKEEAGKLEFQPQRLNLCQFCQELIEDIQLTTNSHKIIFHIHGECHDVCLDETLLRHILSNLLLNAIKYSPNGDTVYFELIRIAEKAIFRVQDREIGIPQAALERLFHSFHRASNVGTISGTGLGLAIVKKTVDLCGGQIEVESQVGTGTTFTVILPLNCY
jgi:signal transduction histidine kinase